MMSKTYVAVADFTAVRGRCLTTHVVWAALLARLAIAQDDSLMSRAESASHASSPYEMAQGYEAVFGKASSAQLYGLMSHRHNGVALRAAWERVRRTVPEVSQQRATKPPSEALQRFIGFAEGRLGFGLPEWWVESVLDTSAYDRWTFGFPLPCGTSPYHKTQLGVSAPQGTNLDEADGALLVQIGTESFRLPLQFQEPDENWSRFGAVSVLLGQARCFVASHSGVPSPYHLSCFDRHSGGLLWGTDVWAGGGLETCTGHGSHWVSLQEENGLLVVVGTGTTAAYVEAFDAATGRSVWRFSTAAIRSEKSLEEREKKGCEKHCHGVRSRNSADGLGLWQFGVSLT